jgi:nitrogen-specific signal transduction histidine kinase/ActR/RegA family two-component response regulator
VVFAFSLDITEQKRAEEEKRIIESQIIHTRKLESLGILAGGVAHDFNNLLTGILGNAGLARMHTPPSDRSLESIRNIEKIAVRAADLCNQLLAYSGKGKFVVLPIDINPVILEMTALLETSLPRKTVLKHQLSREACTIEIDVSQFRQIIMNLILNACDSIGAVKGKIILRTGTAIKIEKKKGTQFFLPENIRPGEFVFLEIQDDGAGMNPDTVDRIFDPFFTTKTDGRGLGLSAVIGIVKGCGGLISIDSRTGTGTVFRIYFPASSKEPVPVRQEKEKTEIWTGTGTILFADDENDIRLLGKTILTKYGFQVITADNGAAALKKFNRYADKIVLVILDLKMPEKDGIEVMNEIFRIKPGLPVILSSGYHKSEAVKDFLKTGSGDFLPKPYPPEKLIETVRRMLENT